MLKIGYLWIVVQYIVKYIKYITSSEIMVKEKTSFNTNTVMAVQSFMKISFKLL